MKATRDDGKRRAWFSTAVLAVLLLLLTGLLSSVAAADPPQIVDLHTADVLLRPGVLDSGGGRYVVLTLEQLPEQAAREALAASGVRLLSYLGGTTYITAVEPGALDSPAAQAQGITAAAPWSAEQKAGLALRQGDLPEEAVEDGGDLRLQVLFFADVSEAEIQALLARHGRAVERRSGPRLWAVTVTPDALPALLAEEGLHSAVPDLPRDLLMFDSRARIHANEVQRASLVGNPPDIRYDGLTGEGILLQVSEDVYDEHPDFQDAAGQSRFDPASVSSWGDDHGTAVAGIMAGNGRLSATLSGSPYDAPLGHWRGIAPEASLYESDYDGSAGPLIDASNHSFTMLYDAYVYGYGGTGAAVDAEIRGEYGAKWLWPQIWAAGNNGFHEMHDNEEGYYSIYSAAKNNIVVGSVNANDGGLSTLVSSMGPTFDGRIKPDVMAPGGTDFYPRGFEPDTDRMQMMIDFIRVIDARSGKIVKGWEFNTNGNTEGWFKSPCQIYGVTAQNGSLRLELGFRPGDACGSGAWGWTRGFSLATNADQVITMRYKISSPAGAMVAGGKFLWDVAGGGGGSLGFPCQATDTWVVTTVPVGQWGVDRGREKNYGGWTGTVNGLGMIPLGNNWPAITAPFYSETTQRAGYSDSQGTSEAAPMVTGSVALLLQQFRDGLGLDLRADQPLPSTIKAILIQTAEDMMHETADARDPLNPDTGAPVLYYEGPDYATGYGLINIKAAVDLVAADPGPNVAKRLFHEGELDGAEQHVYAVDVSERGPLKVTLAWDDYPGDPNLPNATSKLVNDLDLYLIAPDGTPHFPWTLDPLPAAYCGGDGPGCGDLDPILPEDVRPAHKAPDHLNNVEMAQVYEAEPGRWQVVVSAYKMPMAPQSYSVVSSAPMQRIPPAAGVQTIRVSVDASGQEGNAGSFDAQIAADGRYAVFASEADNLVANDQNGTTDVFVHDLETGVTNRLSVTTAGKEGKGYAGSPSISGDGRLVVFAYDAADLDPRCPDGGIFLHDRDTDDDGVYDEAGGVLTRCLGEGGLGRIAADGRFILFHSFETDLDSRCDNGEGHVFVYDRMAEVPLMGAGSGIVQQTCVSISSSGEQANGYARGYDISADGRYIVFDSEATNLVSGDSNGWTDVFVHDRDRDEDGVFDEAGAVETTRVSVSTGGAQGDWDSSFGSLSADGRFVAFGSYAGNLVPGDTNDGFDQFVHDRHMGTTTRVAVDSQGNEGDNMGIATPGVPYISGNGRYVAFVSDSTNLVPGDSNEMTDLFVHDRQSGETQRVSVSASGNQASAGSWGGGLSADGRRIIFESWAANLVPGDTNAWSDVFVRFLPAPQQAGILMPAQENTPGEGWKIGQQVQNAGTQDATVELLAFGATGASYSCGTDVIGPGESANYQTDRDCADAPWDIAAALFKVDQPAVAIANISNWGTGGAGGQYRGTADTESAFELYFPLVKANHYGRSTTFEIQNAGDTANRISATFLVNGKSYTKEFSAVPPYTTVIASPLDAGVPAGNGQVGSLLVMGSGALAGVAVEHEQGVAVARNLQASRAFVPGDYDTVLYCPLFRHAHAAQQQTTGAQVQNVADKQQQIVFRFTPQDGSAPLEITRAIAAGASETFYAPQIGIPPGALGSVTVRGQAGIAAVVNDHGRQDKRETTTTYACFGGKNLTSRVLLPLYKEFYLGNTTGIQVQNAAEDGRFATIKATYYPIGGSSPVTLQQGPVAPGGSVTFWGVSGDPLPGGLTLLSGDQRTLRGSYGSVVVQANTPIAVMANESLFGGPATEADSKNYEGFNMPD